MGAYKLNIGDATHYLKWDGAKLMVKGLIGDITLESDGYIRTDGKDNYADITAGFFLGYDGGAYKLNIGNTNHYLKWDGANLNIKGMLATGSITLDTTGFIKTTGKDSYADTTKGFFLGYDGENYKLNIGDSGHYLKWNGYTLQIKGRLNVGYNTDEDIYFQDSGIRLYDYGSSFISFYKSGRGQCYIGLLTTSVRFESSTGLTLMAGANSDALVYAGGKYFYHYHTGTLQLPALSSAPTAHNGDIAFKASEDNAFRWYATNDTAWHKTTFSSAGW